MFKLRFTFKGGTGFRGRLALEIYANRKRAYILVDSLTNPSEERWSDSQQCFIGKDRETIHNNRALDGFLAKVKLLQETGNFDSPSELVKAYKNGLVFENKKIITFLDLVTRIVADERGKQTAKSNNYQLYLSLAHRLVGPKAPTHLGRRIADTPVTEIDDTHYAAFGAWILKVRGGVGYRNLMVNFKSSLRRGAECYGLQVNELKHPWRKYTPKSSKKCMSARQKLQALVTSKAALSEDEIRKIEAFNMDLLSPRTEKQERLNEIYRDFALLMYYTMSRPADVVLWSHMHNYDEASQQMVYTPHKLRNRCDKVVVVKLCPEAIRIIQKYKGQSNGGYVMPLPMNDRKWPYTIDGEVFESWQIQCNHAEAHINRMLKKMANILKLNVRDLSLYDFRRSAITHAVNQEGANVFIIARQAGTSVRMIEKHYYNDAV